MWIGLVTDPTQGEVNRLWLHLIVETYHVIRKIALSPSHCFYIRFPSQLWLEMARTRGRELRETARDRLDLILQTVQEKTGSRPGMNIILILSENYVVGTDTVTLNVRK